MCHARPAQVQGRTITTQQTQWLELSPDSRDPQEDVIFNIGPKTTSPYLVVMELNNKPITMEIDMGAAVSIRVESGSHLLTHLTH